MLFRQAGIFHTDYAADRALFPIAADRWMIGILLGVRLSPRRCWSIRSISAAICCRGWYGPPAHSASISFSDGPDNFTSAMPP